MTQRIFDRDNAEDMAQLWSILPDNIESIEKKDNNDGILLRYVNGYIDEVDIFKINWHDKTEITRPIQEATEHDIGKICYFWDDNIKIQIYGVLEKIHTEGFQIFYSLKHGSDYRHCRRLNSKEIEELC